FSERRGHADDDRVALFQMIKFDGGPQAARVNDVSDHLRRNVADVRSAKINFCRFSLVNFKSDRTKPVPRKLSCQRQPDIAEPNHANARALVFDETCDFGFDHETHLDSLQIIKAASAKT